MYQNEEYFTFGDAVGLVNGEGETILGVVENYDLKQGLLVLRNDFEDSQFGFFRVLNLKNERSLRLRNINGLDLSKDLELCQFANRRNVEEIDLVRDDLPKRGLVLYKSLRRLFDGRDVAWRGANIVVFHEVVISPPYDKSSIKGNGKCLPFIQKIVQNVTDSEIKKSEI